MIMLGTLLYKLNPAACLRPDIEEATIDGVASDGNKQSVGTAPTSSFTTERSGSSASSAALSCILPSSRYTPDDGGGGPPSPQALDSVLPGIFEGISAVCPGGGDAKTKKSRRKRRTEALSRLHDLTKKPDNRVALCSSGAGRDVVGVLSDALLDSVDPDSVPSEGPGGIDEDRRLICWTINNLTVPYKNKSSIVSSGNFAGLLRGLTAVVSSNLPESYLCCIALLNLTFAAEAVEPVAYFVPPPSDEGRRIRRHPSTAQQLWRDGARTSEMSARVLGNPESLMRVVERMMITNAPFLLSTVKSVQGEAFRWAAGFVRNVTSVDDPLADGGGGRRGSVPDETVEEICSLVARTELPGLAVRCVRDSPRPTTRWTKDSAEDVCLGVICNLARFQPSTDALARAGAARALERLESLPGIHGYRARAVRCRLGELPLCSRKPPAEDST